MFCSQTFALERYRSILITSGAKTKNKNFWHQYAIIICEDQERMEEFSDLTNHVKNFRLHNLEHNNHILSIDQLVDVIHRAKPILSSQPNVVQIKTPKIQVIGDLHGTYESLQHVLPQKLDPRVTYVFLGDYVDRGFFGCEIMYVLLTLLCQSPQNVVLLRGNHECRQVCFQYGFFFELFVKYCTAKYQNVEELHELFGEFIDLFYLLPIAASSEYFVFVHAGCPGNQSTLEELKELDRKRDSINAEDCDICDFDPLNDILWSDFSVAQERLFELNQLRGVSVIYNDVARSNFTSGKTLIRSHSCVDGVCKAGGVITVFSVPRYEGVNRGAFLALNNDEIQYKFFTNPRHAWIDSQPVFQQYSMRSQKNAIFSVILGLVDVEIEPQFSCLRCESGELYTVKQQELFLLTDLIMDYYEQNSESPLQILSMIDDVENCLIVNGKSLRDYGYVFPRIYVERLSREEIEQLLRKCE